MVWGIPPYLVVGLSEIFRASFGSPIWSFPKSQGTSAGLPILRVIAFCSLYCVPHMEPTIQRVRLY